MLLECTESSVYRNLFFFLKKSFHLKIKSDTFCKILWEFMVNRILSFDFAFEFTYYYKKNSYQEKFRSLKHFLQILS